MSETQSGNRDNEKGILPEKTEINGMYLNRQWDTNNLEMTNRSTPFCSSSRFAMRRSATPGRHGLVDEECRPLSREILHHMDTDPGISSSVQNTAPMKTAPLQSFPGTQTPPLQVRNRLLSGGSLNLSRQSSSWSIPVSVTADDNCESESSYQPTETEIKVLAGFSSVNYSPSHSVSYMQWLRNHPLPNLQLDRWTLLTIIAISIGALAWLQKQFLQLLAKWKWSKGKDLIAQDNVPQAFVWVAFISSVYIICGSFLVVFVHPPARGSGVPEVISFLNGVIVHRTFTLRNLIVKFVANILAVGSGIPCAIQGPIIAMGATVAAGVGQFQSKSLKFKPNIFIRFRNAEDRRSFTTAGVAAGVAAAFNAPIGGLLFAMEDLSSFWSHRLCWQTFYTAGVAAITANLLNYPFTGFNYTGRFGFLTVAFSKPLQLHVAALLPAIFLGLCGGLVGTSFTLLNTGIVKVRKIILSFACNPYLEKSLLISEVLILAVGMVGVTVFLPGVFACRKYPGGCNLTLAGEISPKHTNVISTLDPYTCYAQGNTTAFMYNEVSTLMQGTGTQFLNHLWTRGLHRLYNYIPLLCILPIWSIMTSWACGSALAGGIFIPNLVTGAIYGRLLGLFMVDIYRTVTGYDHPVGTDWDWMDPGLIAVIGSGSMLGGVTRLCLAVTVIVVEMSEDLNLIIPVLISIFTAKVIADAMASPLYKYQLKSKMLPYLDPDLKVKLKGQRVNLDLIKVKDVMAKPVYTLHITESLSRLANILITTEHEGFPVIKYSEESKQEVAYGFVTRTELYVLLCSSDVYDQQISGTIVTPELEYDEISVDYIPDPSFAVERVRSYTRFEIYQNIFIGLEPYINISAPKVDEDYSLLRAYMLFRTLGLRHLMVIDVCNRVTGILTRKDLMRFRIEQRLVEMAMNEKEIEISPSLDRTSYNILDDESAFEVHSLQQEDETEA